MESSARCLSHLLGIDRQKSTKSSKADFFIEVRRALPCVEDTTPVTWGDGVTFVYSQLREGELTFDGSSLCEGHVTPSSPCKGFCAVFPVTSHLQAPSTGDWCRCVLSSHPLYSPYCLCDRSRAGRYRGTSLIRTPPPVGPYSSPMPRDLW